MQVKEPYYLDNYSTSIKSFNCPHIPKVNSFTSNIKRSKSESHDKIIPLMEIRHKTRSDSLEPYYRPSFPANYDPYEDVIIDDDDAEFDDYMSVHLLKPFPNAERAASQTYDLTRAMAVRDDYDNDTKFDFFL